MTAGGTFATRSTQDGQVVGDKTVAAVGSYSFDATFAGTKPWVAHMATFKGGQYQSVSGLGFTPDAVFLASAMDITRTAPVAEARLGFGAGDGTRRFTSSTQDQDNAGTSRVRPHFDKTSKVFIKIDNTTTAARPSSTPRPT